MDAASLASPQSPEKDRGDELLCTKATFQVNILGPKYIIFGLTSFLAGRLSG